MLQRIRLLFIAGLVALIAMPAAAGLLWEARYETPGVFSSVNSGYSQEVNLPDENSVSPFLDSQFDETTTTAEISAFSATSADSICLSECPKLARAQTDFNANHASAFTRLTRERTGNNGEFFIREHSSARAISGWVDHWNFTSSVLGGRVHLPISVDVVVDESSLCPEGPCGGVGIPGIDQTSFNDWSYSISATLTVFDLDELVEFFPNPDSEAFELVPRRVAFVEFSQIGVDSNADFIEEEDPDGGFNEDGSPATIQIPNGKLNDLVASGEASFVPLPGRHYATVLELDLIAQNGADLDGFNTLTLDQIILPAGMTLNSVAMQSLGAQFNIVTPVPVPAGLPLLASGLAALGGWAHRRRDGCER